MAAKFEECSDIALKSLFLLHLLAIANKDFKLMKKTFTPLS
jgi:hypothetical protein